MSQTTYDPTSSQTGRLSSEDAPYRFAVVGCGPRGLYCLDELRIQLSRCQVSRPCEILVFEPSHALGAGVVYDPQQPPFLRMNFAAVHINAWRESEPSTAGRLRLVDWLRNRGDVDIRDDSYVPRATVGEYLEHCLKDVIESLTCEPTVIIEPVKIRRVGRVDNRWRLYSETSTWEADEVLLTVGHEGWRSPPLREQRSRSAVNVLPADFLTRERSVPARSTVAIRGFGLTAIDGILALTEGRGGRFENDRSGLRYVASGREPKRILPFSRTGRPMLAKPVESLMRLPGELTHLWSEARTELSLLTRPLGRDAVRMNLWRIIANTAANALQITSQSRDQPCHSVSGVDDWFTVWSETLPSDVEVTELLNNSVEVACGYRDADIPWALGETWRKLYPALVKLINHGGLAADGWDEFSPIAVEMERIAFGPPAENVERLLALVDAEILDLSCLQGVLSESSKGSLQLQSRRSSVKVEMLLNAVLPSPVDYDPQGPLAELLSNNHIQRLHRRLGINVDETGTPMNDEGNALPGLSILGRSTEGCVLGNDTLNRELHPHPRLWAQSAVQRFLSTERNSAHAY